MVLKHIKDVKEFSDDEVIHALNTIHDTSLQNKSNEFWWVCFDMQVQKELFERIVK